MNDTALIKIIVAVEIAEIVLNVYVLPKDIHWALWHTILPMRMRRAIAQIGRLKRYEVNYTTTRLIPSL